MRPSASEGASAKVEPYVGADGTGTVAGAGTVTDRSLGCRTRPEDGKAVSVIYCEMAATLFRSFGSRAATAPSIEGRDGAEAVHR